MLRRGSEKIKHRGDAPPVEPTNPGMMRPHLATLLLLAACHRGPSSSPRIATAEDLVRAMHDRYASTWYRTLSFQQDAIQTKPDGSTSTEVWLEAAEVPGRLWIDTGPAGAGNGVIYRSDSVYVLRDGAVARAARARNALLLLGFDVYRQPAETTLRQLQEEGVRLGAVRTDRWEGRPVYVVGADSGDVRSKQFWVDAERLLFVRLIQPTGPTGTSTSDIRFNRYERHGGGWVAPEVDFLVDGRRTLLERYANVQVDVPLDTTRFDPGAWKKQ